MTDDNGGLIGVDLKTLADDDRGQDGDHEPRPFVTRFFFGCCAAVGDATVMLSQAMRDDRELIRKGLMTQGEFDQEWYLSTDAAIKWRRQRRSSTPSGVRSTSISGHTARRR